MATGQMLEPRVWARTRFLADLLMLTLASSAAVFAAPELATARNRLLATLFPLVAIVIMHVRHDVDDRLHASILDAGADVVRAISSAAVLTLAAASIVGGSHPVALTLRLWLFAVVYAGVARVVLMSVRIQTTRAGAAAVPTLVLGAGSVGELLVKRIADDPRYGMRPVGFLDSDPMPRRDGPTSPAIPVLGGPADLASAIGRTGARRVILAFSSEPDHLLIDRVTECQQLGVEVLLVPRLFESINHHVTLDHVGEVPVLWLRPTNPRGAQFAIKHALDRILALVALIALAPLMALVALGVRLSSPGPALFRQRRVGRDGRVFNVLKFRTMREADPDRESAFVPPDGCAPGGVEGEDRRTPLGVWLRGASLDEVPQLINVLRGEMSIVGPRPERPQFAARFGEEVERYDDRLRVKSGITGWAQVNGLRGQTSIADRVKWDNYYIQNWSWRLDLRIILLTIVDVFRSRGSGQRPRGRPLKRGSRPGQA
ncbi:MAG: sugar transferase [Solirubrobacteraceae bacterium]